MRLTNCVQHSPSIVKKKKTYEALLHDSDLPDSDVSFGVCTYRSLIRSWVNRPPPLCLSLSQGRLAVPALWPWHPKMLCPLPWPSPSRLMPTSKELIPLSESHMMSCSSKFPTWICTHMHFCPYLNFNNTWCYRLQSTCVAFSRSAIARFTLFAQVWHHSFRVNNLHVVVWGRENIQAFIG